MPITIASTVSHRVFLTPLSDRLAEEVGPLLRPVPHVVGEERVDQHGHEDADPPRHRPTAPSAGPGRPGWSRASLPDVARRCSHESRSAAQPCAPLTLASVDRAVADAPLLHDRLVGAVLDERLDGLLESVAHLRVLLDGDAVGSGLVDCSPTISILSPGLLDRVTDDRQVGEHASALPDTRSALTSVCWVRTTCSISLLAGVGALLGLAR